MDRTANLRSDFAPFLQQVVIAVYYTMLYEVETKNRQMFSFEVATGHYSRL